MRDGIVITGMGVVTPVGIGVDTYWENLTAGVCGIGEITQIDTTALPIHRAAEVHGFHPKDFMPTRLALDLEPYQQYAYAAAEQALAQSGLQGSARVGVVMATALHGLTIITKTQTRIDALVVSIVKEQYQKATQILTENRAKLDELAKYLYEKETITGEEYMNILNKKEA